MARAKKILWFFVRAASGMLIATIFLAMSYALYQVLCDPNKGFKSADAASWIQAISSIAAILGALGIYHAQAKREKGSRDVLATLVATRFTPSITLLTSECKRMLKALQDDAAVASNRRPFETALAILTFKFDWDVADLEAMSSLPKGSAKRFASGIGHFEAAVNLLKKGLANPRMDSFNPDYRIGAARNISALLDVASVHLEKAARQMHEITIIND